MKTRHRVENTSLNENNNKTKLLQFWICSIIWEIEECCDIVSIVSFTKKEQFKILEILEIFDPLLAQILLVIAILDQRFLALVLRPGQCLQYLQLFHHLNLQYYYSIATIQHQNQFLASPSTYPCQWGGGWVSDW